MKFMPIVILKSLFMQSKQSLKDARKSLILPVGCSFAPVEDCFENDDYPNGINFTLKLHNSSSNKCDIRIIFVSIFFQSKKKFF